MAGRGRPAFTGWLRRAGKGGRWQPVATGRTEQEAYRRTEAVRYGSAPWRDYSFCEWLALEVGREPKALFRRR